MKNEAAKVYSVSEFNRAVKESLEDQYPDVWIEGELSNYRGVATSGHCYFSLKDEGAQIDIVAFRGVMSSLKFKLQDGLKLLLLGRASLYPQRGRFQVIATLIEPRGIGALQMAFEQLKKKLEKEGLFDPSRKKPIPFLPQKIGIVTSPTGAAIRDILNVIHRRFTNVEILIYPVKVQGEGAKEEIVEGIKYLNEQGLDLDVLLVGRGGGSIEDLWAFNEEIVARAIVKSKIPVISCVGHEIDFTIADFVADLRAPTPSAAAELVVKNKLELQSVLGNHFARLEQTVLSSIHFFYEQLKSLTRVPMFARPKEIFEGRTQIIDDLWERLDRSLKSHLEKCQNHVELFRSKVALLSPKSVLKEKEQLLRSEFEKCLNAFNQKQQKLQEKLKVLAGQLEAMSPLAVLSRGYAIAWSCPENKILKSALQVAVHDSVRVKLHQGEFKAMVQETIVEPRKSDQMDSSSYYFSPDR